MKVHLLLPLLIVVSVLMVGVMKMRKQQHDRENRLDRFQAIKLQVTYDVLGDYQNEKGAHQILLERAESDYKTLGGECKTLKIREETTKRDEDDCLADKASQKSVQDLVEKEFRDVTDYTEKERTNWKTEVETLQQQLAERSKVCNFVKPGSQSSQLCGIEAEAPKPEPPKEEAKAEAPKPEAPKEEAKAEAPKPEAPKEEAKAEAPKPEPPKEEAKAEAPKPEAPKEEAKAEAPKPEPPKEEAKAEAPKPEAPKEEAKAEAPKPEAPKEEAKAEAPKEEAKAEAPKEETKAEAPKAEAPKEEAKAEAPKAEAPKEEAKAEAPKEEAKAEAPKKR